MINHRLTWGNPNIEQFKQISTSDFLDFIFNEKQKPFPDNDSMATHSELEDVKLKLNQIIYKDNSDALSRFLSYDVNLCQSIFNTLKANPKFEFHDEEMRDLIVSVHSDVQPLILKLKFLFNRPRPNQLANSKGLNLYPMPGKNINTPAYPSGTVVSAIAILEIIGNKFPEYYQYMKDIIDDISISRLYLGFNLSSDIDYGHELGKAIITHPSITAKYKF